MTSLVAMTQQELDAYVETAIAEYAADKVAAGQWPEDGALDRARHDYLRLLPAGVDSPGHHLFTMRASDGDPAGEAVGVVWLAVVDRDGQRLGFVYDLYVKPEHRRRGHAAAAMTAIEGVARGLGLSRIGLHVFGHNASARALYTKLGYVETNVNMSKRLDGGA